MDNGQMVASRGQMVASRGQMVSLDLVVLVLGASILLTTAYLALPVPDDALHQRVYSQQMMLDAVEDSGLLLARYACEPGQDLKQALVEAVNSSLSSTNRPGWSYILAASDIRVYSDVEEVCLEKVDVVHMNLTTSCRDMEIVFGMWPMGQEVVC